MAAIELIKSTQEVIKKLVDQESLSHTQFDRLLRNADQLMNALDGAIDETVHSQSALLQMREKLENAMNSTSEAGNFDDYQEVSRNRFSVFGGSEPSVREEVHVSDSVDFDVSSDDFNY